ncbi:ketopantoate reductase family protein [Rathayibacter rathayi]|uniref:2-dehydropantoate 2-reductase n=1 Tax=Rathayibacter rathayi TaxID=33887 RepID=A0ABX5AFV4_RATRA|nr:ketopantoate reductase family protein [Rathayibacter rathayi]AZZ49142.1 ketopantoate reductase family protein [Rathayibacter rathayi]MWV73199.1 2-dehydropantoate 2-reductase [Rathayibacter rathayi NCPPB 2980 = VKM Ac-1601]PPF51865.1 ketopantoate reductase family protein [Rathayibacter rathayi]PPF83471.1 ketopantoate reductase family protein [Rathayibacter rathayi]PPG16262.1 ketopantoate reductase family protein [Rathayibacter rathayi]
MRIAVLGAGAVGGTVAALLDRAGHDVEVTARGDHLTAIRRSGLRLDGAWGEHTAWVRCGETLDLVPDLALVCTKAQDAEDALRSNRRTVDGTLVVIVQNGLDGLTAAARQVRDARLVGALALFAASRLEPGRVTVTAAASTTLGVPGRPADDDVRRAAAVLGEAVPTAVTDDFLGAQWTKLLINEVNALPAITGLSVQETVADQGLRRVLARALREAARTGIAAGVRFGSLQGLSNTSVRALAAAPLPVVELLPRRMAAGMGEVPNPGSTLQSIRRGVPSEIDHLAGAVVRTAHRGGREAPVNQLLVDLVHDVERAGTFLPPADVVRRAAAV